jgi:hypothetical protein
MASIEMSLFLCWDLHPSWPFETCAQGLERCQYTVWAAFANVVHSAQTCTLPCLWRSPSEASDACGVSICSQELFPWVTPLPTCLCMDLINYWVGGSLLWLVILDYSRLVIDDGQWQDDMKYNVSLWYLKLYFYNYIFPQFFVLKHTVHFP